MYIGLLYSVWKKYLDPCFQTEESVESPKLLVWDRCKTVLVQTHLHLPQLLKTPADRSELALSGRLKSFTASFSGW